MTDTFFAHEDQLPAGTGFSLFGPTHLFWLGAILIAGFLAAFFYRRADVATRRRVGRILVTVIVGLDLTRDIILIVTDRFDPAYLPFQLCGMAVYITWIHGFFPSKTTQEFLYLLCMPGAVAALLFPNWNIYPQLNYMNLNGFLLHGMLVIYPWMLLSSGEIRPDIRRYYRVLVFLFGATLFAAVLNHQYDTNFLFLAQPSPDSPLVWIYHLTGGTWYLPGYAVVVVAVHMCLYLVYDLVRNRKRLR